MDEEDKADHGIAPTLVTAKDDFDGGYVIPGYKNIISGVQKYYIRGTKVLDP